MMRKILGCMAITASLTIILAVDAGYGQPPGGAEESAATKVLKANPALRKALEKSEVFQKLKAALPRAKVGEKTYFFPEGDLRLDEDQLLLYARERAVQNERFEQVRLGGPAPSGAPLPGQLLADTVNGRIIRWPPGSTLSYCVQRKTFANDQEHKTVADAMKKACDAWSATCNIKFTHNTSLDGSTPASSGPPSGVTFCVRKTGPAGGVIASAFFPKDPRSERVVLINPPFFSASLGFDRVGVLRHELGHVLGFRHEHIRSEAPPVCGTGEPLAGALPLTAFDPRSVMHYFCPEGMAGTRELAITATDKEGALKIYPKAGPGAGLAGPDEAFQAVAP